mgnify:CR=1 FL=1
MDVCYDCNINDTNEKLKNEINFCLMKISASICNDLYVEKKEYKIKKIIKKMLIETCEFIISQNCTSTKKNNIL